MHSIRGRLSRSADPQPGKTHEDKAFGLLAKLFYTDNTYEYHYVAMNPDLTDWQFASLTIVPKESDKTVQKIRVYCDYDRNANTVYFAGILLVREPEHRGRFCVF